MKGYRQSLPGNRLHSHVVCKGALSRCPLECQQMPALLMWFPCRCRLPCLRDCLTFSCQGGYINNLSKPDRGCTQAVLPFLFTVCNVRRTSSSERLFLRLVKIFAGLLGYEFLRFSRNELSKFPYAQVSHRPRLQWHRVCPQQRRM